MGLDFVDVEKLIGCCQGFYNLCVLNRHFGGKRGTDGWEGLDSEREGNEI